MKSHKSMLPIIAMLALLVISLAIAAPSTASAAETRDVNNVTSDPKWVDHTPFTKDTIKVHNLAAYTVTVTFRDGPGNALASFQVISGATSNAQTLPLNTDKICVIKTSGGTVEDILDATYYIPTLSEWAMILFSVVLLGLMTYYVIRRRRIGRVTAI